MADLPKNSIALTVNGKTFEGFEGGNVQLTMEDACNTFSLDYVADGKKPGARAIFAGDECELSIDAGSGMESLIKGFVDGVSDSDDGRSILLSCNGRSMPLDLYDASAVTKPGSWKNASLSKIANDIAKPFGVKVVIDGDAGDPFTWFSISKGETGFEAIHRAATKRGMWPFSVGGDLVIATAGSKSSGAKLERGKNIVRSSRTDSWQGRHSEYIYRGQVRGTDSSSGKKASQNKASVKDATINRYRPLLLQSSGVASELKMRAQVEANTRAGRGEVITCVVDGWGTPAGKVYRPNTTADFKNDVLGVDATLLIVAASYNLGAHVSRDVELRMMRKEAFDMVAFPKAKRGAKLT